MGLIFMFQRTLHFRQMMACVVYARMHTTRSSRHEEERKSAGYFQGTKNKSGARCCSKKLMWSKHIQRYRTHTYPAGPGSRFWRGLACSVWGTSWRRRRDLARKDGRDLLRQRALYEQTTNTPLFSSSFDGAK